MSVSWLEYSSSSLAIDAILPADGRSTAWQKRVLRQKESGEEKASLWPRSICMFGFSGNRHLVKNVTMYCFLSETIQLINLREINNIPARMRQIFGVKTEAVVIISRLFYGLTVNIETFFKNFACVKFSLPPPPFLPFFMEFRWSV